MNYRYYKIIYNQEIIDVNTDFLVNYVNYQSYNKSLMICKSNENPIGITSSDNSEVYHIDGWAEIPNTVLGEYKTVTMVEIDETTYNILKTALDEKKIIIEPEIEPEPQPEPQPEPPKTEEEIRAENEYLRSLQFVKDSKIKYMSYLCNQTIENGIDVVLSDGKTHHYSLTSQDQINIITSRYLIDSGLTEGLAYHEDGEDCDYISVEDMNKIALTGISFIKYHTTYFNSLRSYIESLDSMVDVSEIYYGVEIPEEYQSNVLKDLIKQMESANETNETKID